MEAVTAQDFKDALEGEDELIEVLDEILNTPVGKLAVLVANEIAVEVYGGATGMASPLLPILIELLPILADLLGRNCNPEQSRLMRALQTKRPFFRRRYANQINTWAIGTQGPDVFQELGGRKFGGIALSVLGNPEHEELVLEAMNTPSPVQPPVWSILVD